MGVRGLIRDLIGLYAGFRFMISPLFPLSAYDTLMLGFLVFGFSLWFTLERVGFLGTN